MFNKEIIIKNSFYLVTVKFFYVKFTKFDLQTQVYINLKL